MKKQLVLISHMGNDKRLKVIFDKLKKKYIEQVVAVKFQIKKLILSSISIMRKATPIRRFTKNYLTK